MEKTVKITVLVAVYNAEKFLEKCLDSLLSQTLHNIQIVCIDDCSTDHSAQILMDYARRDERICLMHTPVNSGQAVARNVGLSVAQGEYTTMLDSDDWYAPDTLEKAYLVLQSDAETDCVLLDCIMHDDLTNAEVPYVNRTTKSILTGEEAFRLSLDWRIHGLYVVRTALHKQYPYDTTCKLYSDDNTTRLHYLYSRRVAFCSGRYYYRQHAASSTKSCSIRRFDYMEANLSMRRQLDAEAAKGSFTNQREVLRLYETHRWSNLIGCYGYLLQHRSEFSKAERREIKQRMKRVFQTITPSLIRWQVKFRPGYYPWPSFRLFLLQSWAYLTVRRVFLGLRVPD